MHTRTLAAMTAVGLTAAIAVPTIAFGNARNNLGSLHFEQVANTPYTARLSGANEVPPSTDLDAIGAASVTFDIINSADAATGAEVCWDFSYSGIDSPTLAEIRRGASGVNGPAVASFAPVAATSSTGCAVIAPPLVNEIVATPANFYLSVGTVTTPGGVIRGQLSKGPVPAGEAHLLPVPLRAYDSRDNNGAKIAALQTRTVSLISGKDGAGVSAIAVPPGATAAIVTLTVTETVGPGGFLKLYSAALIDPPATSAINWAGTNQNLATTTQVAVDATGSVKVTGGANSTHFVIDVVGYLF
jgi:CHRD domain